MTTNEYVTYFLLRQRLTHKNKETWNRPKLVQDLLCQQFTS